MERPLIVDALLNCGGWPAFGLPSLMVLEECEPDNLCDWWASFSLQSHGALHVGHMKEKICKGSFDLYHLTFVNPKAEAIGDLFISGNATDIAWVTNHRLDELRVRRS